MLTLNTSNRIDISSVIESINITYYSTIGSEQHTKLLTFRASTTITTTTTVTSYTSTSNGASYWTIVAAVILFVLGFMLGWLGRKRTG